MARRPTRSRRPPGAGARIVNLPWLNRIDSEWLKATIGQRHTVITLDNHYVRGGQGDMIAAAVAELGMDPAPAVARIGCNGVTRMRDQR
jgi:transketolase